jgi:outer membrane lipoprotein-sorting protein
VRNVLRVGVAAGLVLAFSGALRAEEPKEIIDKAIKAAGGEEKLAKFNARTWAAKGTYYGAGDGTAYTAEYAVQLPDKMRVEIKNVFTMVLNGDKGWMKMGDNAEEMNADQLTEQKENAHAGYVATLLPLKDRAYTLTALGDSKVGDRAVVGVKVSSKGHRDVNLYFDKDTNLLAKGEWTVKAMEEGGKEVTQETLYSDYKDVDGTKFPMKVVLNRDGKKYVESENSDVKAVEKLDDSLFGKP